MFLSGTLASITSMPPFLHTLSLVSPLRHYRDLRPYAGTAKQIERELERIAAELGTGQGDRLRRAFVHYLERTEVENLEVRPRPGGGHHH